MRHIFAAKTQHDRDTADNGFPKAPRDQWLRLHIPVSTRELECRAAINHRAKFRLTF